MRSQAAPNDTPREFYLIEDRTVTPLTLDNHGNVLRAGEDRPMKWADTQIPYWQVLRC